LQPLQMNTQYSSRSNSLRSFLSVWASASQSSTAQHTRYKRETRNERSLKFQRPFN
jgi:hypothetical protein